MLNKITYAGWENCYQLSNDKMILIITADVGPRIIHCGLRGQANLFKEYPDQIGKTESDNWLIFGGHRLWHAPESLSRTYYPDLEPVHIQEIENGLIATQKPEPTTGLQKQIEIRLSEDKPEAYLIHRLFNHNLWAVETAPWCLSVMAPGGVAILPLPPRGPHPDCILPTSSLAIWPYTDLSDKRWVFGKQYILLNQDTSSSQPQKLGIYSTEGWAAYINMNTLFLKQVPTHFDATYPDLGVNFEVFTNREMLELESLGPIDSIPPKGKIEHQEHWTLIAKVPTPESEADVQKFVVPHL